MPSLALTRIRPPTERPKPMAYQRLYRSPESRRLQSEIARASRDGDATADKLPELRRRFVISTICDKIQQALDNHAPIDGLSDLDKRAITAAFHRIIEDAPRAEA